MKKHLTFKDEKSDKFWSIETSGTSFTVTYGKTGTTGQASIKDFDTEEKCLNEAEKLVNEKLGKGYEEGNAPSLDSTNTSVAPTIRSRYKELQNGFKSLLNKEAHVLVDGTLRNVRLFDWFKFDESDVEDFYDRFSDLDEDCVHKKYIKKTEDGLRLRKAIVPFGYLVDDGAINDGQWQEEAILMFDFRSEEMAPVLVAEIDGTIDPTDPFLVIKDGLLGMNLTSGRKPN